MTSIKVTPIMLRNLIEGCLEEYHLSANELTVGNLLNLLDILQKEMNIDILQKEMNI